MSTASTSSAPRVDIYSRVTNRIVEQLEQGIRPWMQPWNADRAAGRITLGNLQRNFDRRCLVAVLPQPVRESSFRGILTCDDDLAGKDVRGYQL